MKTFVLFLSTVLMLGLFSCGKGVDVELIQCSPKNYDSEYWAHLSVKILGNTKIPKTNERKVDHKYLAVVRYDDTVDSEKFFKDRPADAVVSSLVSKEDNTWISLIFTDDPNGLKQYLKNN